MMMSIIIDLRKGGYIMQKNNSIREYAKKRGVYMYQIAEFLGIGEATINRWLRSELDSDKKELIINAIDSIFMNNISNL